MTREWPPYPPPRETDLDKAARIGEEREAKKIRYAPRAHLRFAPKAFHAEIDAWRAVIQLNLVRSVNVVVGLLARGPNKIATIAISVSPDYPRPKVDLRWLKMRLAPLRQVELILNRVLGVQDPVVDDDAEREWDSDRLSEVALRSRTAWRMLTHSGKERPASRFWDDLLDAQRILDACREDVVQMCVDPLVQALLAEHGIALADEPGFFFHDADRIAAIAYEPTSEDILRARIRTIGVEEHRLVMESRVRFADHVEQYGDQPNEFESVTKYITKVMVAIHKDLSPKKRKVHVHTTCAIDTDMMSVVLESIRDVILLNTLEETQLIV
ncbi:hypothetical protein IEO21_08843 [Rhodonia placenta]|uniref:Uncharacterized protein n=1 Tax=Rhodonia placenta TaxID=104341 RepID=A0A8H7NVG4_9APHY|nr:hypothetical protein IEO21_08843 [Postia placenta]